MSRSRWKLLYFSKTVLRGIVNLQKKKIFDEHVCKPLNGVLIYSRASCIPFCFRGLSLRIHKGNNSRKLKVTYLNAGSKFGEYAYTRKFYYYPLKKKKRRLLRR